MQGTTPQAAETPVLERLVINTLYKKQMGKRDLGRVRVERELNATFIDGTNEKTEKASALTENIDTESVTLGNISHRRIRGWGSKGMGYHVHKGHRLLPPTTRPNTEGKRIFGTDR